MPRHGDRANQSDATAYANRARTTSYCRRAVRGARPSAHPLTSFCTSGGVISPALLLPRRGQDVEARRWPRHEPDRARAALEGRAQLPLRVAKLGHHHLRAGWGWSKPLGGYRSRHRRARR